MARITAAAAVEATIAELTKEGNKVAKSGVLPPGRHADKGYDVQSFNSGMRYAMQKISTAVKQVAKGTFQMPSAALAKKAATTKAPAKKAAATTKKDHSPTAQARAKAKKTTKGVKKSGGSDASITPIEEARAAVAASGTTKKVVRR